jgi:XTP/dITP diphosphohydrolase
MENVQKLISELRAVRDPEARTARYRTVLVLRYPNGDELVAEGVVEGVIPFSAVGAGGFGYDPAFVPLEGDGRTFAQMTLDEKGALSHRGRALKRLRQQLEERADTTATQEG